jgi:hypothetical protein
VAARLRKDEAADDWFSNFNDLSIEEETVKKGSTKKKEDTKKTIKSKSKENEKPKKRESNLARLLEEADGDRAQEQATREEGGGFEGLKARLSYTAADDKPLRRVKTGELDDISSRALVGIPRDTQSTGHASTNVRSSFESVLNGLLNTATPEVSTPEVTPEYPGTRRLAHLKNRPSLGSVDDIKIDGGVVASRPKVREAPAPSEDLHYGEPMSIATKARVVRERPKWGGVTAPPNEGGPLFKASFDSLQRADKVSAPPKRPSTAFSAKPWGLKGSSADKGAAKDLGERSDAAAETTEAPNSGSFAGLLGFKKLRNMLYGSKDDAATEAVGPEENRATGVGAVDRVGMENPQPTTDSQFGAPSQEDSTSADPPSTIEQEQAKPAYRSPSRARRERRSASRAKQRALREIEQAADVKSSEPVAQIEPAKVNAREIGTSNSPVQSTESVGRSMSEVMVGRELADAMGPMNDSENFSEDGPAEDAESGLPIIDAKNLQITALNIEQPPVPGLSYGLDRVLFNPGVVSLQDQHSRVYNFDPYLQNVMPVQEFDFNALQQYKTSSQDSALSELAKAHNKKYVGSTSSMTSTLSHFHYLLSGWRDLNLGMLSRQFPQDRATFTAINRAPTAIFLRWKNGTYAIDADKEHDSGNILMMLGKSMEKLLTMSRSEYERYRKSDPREITKEERNMPEAYEYTSMGDFLMRSQLDAYDSRLPGNGMFDIKTRAIASIRMSTTDYKPMLGYEILTQQGQWESYEREYYDMMRSTMLKYMLQARMGRMDGIFMAYHNVERIFGFQYMPISEIDRAIHGQNDRCLGDQEFKVSVDLLNKVLEEATAKFPNKSLRLHFETRATPLTAMYVFAEPMEEEAINEIQSKSKEKIAAFERKMMGIEAREDATDATKDESPDATSAAPSLLENGTHAPLYAATILVGSIVNGERVERPERLRPEDDWSVEYLLKEMDDPAAAWATYAQVKAKRHTTFSRAVSTDDEGGAESLDDVEPNVEMHDDDGSVRTFENFFLEKLRRLAEKGREFRKNMDELEHGQDKVVYGQPASDKVTEVGSTAPSQQTPVELASSEGKTGEPTTNPATDYMSFISWMYPSKENQAPAQSATKAFEAATGEPTITSATDYMSFISWMYPSKGNQAPAQSADKPSEEPEINGVEDYMSWMYKDRK